MKTPRTLVSGGYDHSIRFWDLKTAKLLRNVPFQSSHINQVKFSMDGRLLAVCGNPAVEFYDMRTNTEKSVHTINFHSDNVTCLSFKDNGPFIATCSEDKTVGLWDLRVTSPLHTWKSLYPFSCVCYGRDESEIFTSDYSGSARIWDITTQQESGRLKTRDSSILTGFLYERAHSLFVMFGSSGFVYISLLKPKKESFNCRIRRQYIFGQANYEVDQESKGYFEKITKLRATKRYVLKASLSEEGLLLANASEDGYIKLWGDINNPNAYDEGRWQQNITLGRHQKWVWDCQFLHGTRYLVSASSDKKVLLWNWEKRLLLQEFSGHEKAVTSVDVSNS
ncbi:hypothetical protein GpartN1_g3071.t1 [Galdieria partita]|uniref:Uncharacterized protein n=1 Tax=Galdieria partita TaxID=83374 RepID=A0A9C7PVU8_9RHOD|nr:hypothetical protein GpartN1_g3071.t1 [Galdieria partita]